MKVFALTIASIALVTSLGTVAHADAVGYNQEVQFKEVVLKEKLASVGICNFHYSNSGWIGSFIMTAISYKQRFMVNRNGNVIPSTVKEIQQVASKRNETYYSYNSDEASKTKALSECEGKRYEFVMACKYTQGCKIETANGQ